MDPVVQSSAAKSCHSSLNANYSDFVSKIDCFAEMVDAKVDAENKATEAVSLWNILHKTLCKTEAEKLKDLYGLFEKLYLLTARLILKGIWYTAITKNNNKKFELYKNGLLDPLNGIIALNIHPGKNDLCQSLLPLLDSSPWGLPYITIIISQDLNKSLPFKSIVDTLWERENAVLLKVRLEFLCSAKMYDQAFSIAHACYLKGYWNYEDSNGEPTPNENIQHNDYTRELYYQFTDILYLLLCRLNNPTKYNDVLSLRTALEVVERLKSETGKIAPKWKEWKRGSRTIIFAISEYLINRSQLQVDADVLRRLFSHWILCSSKSVEDGEEIHPVKEVLSRINLINTDYAYEFANTILEDFSSHPSSGVKFVEIYIRALNKDVNQLESLKAAENHNHELMKTHQKKLAQRYLKMADVFSSDKEMSFEMTLTAFSLNPIESLFRRLFETNSSDENVTLNGSSESVIQNQVYKKIELTSALNDDLQTVIMGCRWTSLCWEKDKSELKKLCRQHMETGGLKIKSKEDLTNLLIDYDTYKPPPLPDDSINDYGFEKGYEPKALESLVKKNVVKSRKNSKVANPVRQQKNRGRRPKTFSENNYTPKSRILNSSEDSYRLQSLMYLEKGRRHQKSGVNKIPKLNIKLESRLRKFSVSDFSESSFVTPPDIFISSVEYPRAVPPKEFCFLGDSDSIWNNIINSQNFLTREDQVSSLDKIQEKYVNNIPVDEDFWSSLADKQGAVYNCLKFNCNVEELQPRVVLQREIPSNLVHSVAFSAAMERVIEAIQESLQILQYAFENPTSSPSLLAIISSPSDSQLSPASLDDPEILDQIIHEAYNTVTSQDLYSKSVSTTTTDVKKSPTRSNALKPGPKGKQNSFLMNQARVTLTRALEMKAQALGLEIDSNGKVVCAKSQLPPPHSVLSSSIEPPVSNSEIGPILSAQQQPQADELPQIKRMDELLKSLTLLRLNNLKSKSSQPDSIPLKNLSSCPQPLVIQDGTILTEPSIQINNNESESQTNEQTKSAIEMRSRDSISLQELMKDTDSKILEIANLLYGDFIQDDLRSLGTVEEMSNDEINLDEDTITTNTLGKRKGSSWNDDAEPERKLRKISPRQVMSSSNNKRDEKPVPRKRGRPRRNLMICTKEDEVQIEEDPIPKKMEVILSLPEVPPPPKMPEISKETVENHSLYQQGIMYLNEETGMMDPISEDQNLHFEELEERYEDISSDAEEEVESSKILKSENEQSDSSQSEEIGLMESSHEEENVDFEGHSNEDQFSEKQQDNLSSDTDDAESSKILEVENEQPDSSQPEETENELPDSSQPEETENELADSFQPEETDNELPDSCLPEETENEQSDSCQPEETENEQSDSCQPEETENEQSDSCQPEETELMESSNEEENVHVVEIVHPNEDELYEKQQDKLSSDTDDVESSKILEVENEQHDSSQPEETELMESSNEEENVDFEGHSNEDQFYEEQQDKLSSDTDDVESSKILEVENEQHDSSQPEETENEQPDSCHPEETELMESSNEEENVHVVEIVHPNEDEFCEKRHDIFSATDDVEPLGTVAIQGNETKISRKRKTPAKYQEFYSTLNRPAKSRKSGLERSTQTTVITKKKRRVKQKEEITSVSNVVDEPVVTVVEPTISTERIPSTIIAIAIDTVVRRAVKNTEYVAGTALTKRRRSRRISNMPVEEVIPVLTPAGTILHDEDFHPEENTMPILQPES